MLNPDFDTKSLPVEWYSWLYHVQFIERYISLLLLVHAWLMQCVL